LQVLRQQISEARKRQIVEEAEKRLREERASEGFCLCGCGEKTPLAPVTDKNKGWTKGEPLLYAGVGHHRRGKLANECIRGHDLTNPDNVALVRRRTKLERRCKLCHREAERARKQSKQISNALTT
jgi:hypothetical protein